MVQQLRDDPTGKMFGGAINEKVVYDLMVRKLRMFKLPASVLNTPNPTRLTDDKH